MVQRAGRGVVQGEVGEGAADVEADAIHGGPVFAAGSMARHGGAANRPHPTDALRKTASPAISLLQLGVFSWPTQPSISGRTSRCPVRNTGGGRPSSRAAGLSAWM